MTRSLVAVGVCLGFAVGCSMEPPPAPPPPKEHKTIIGQKTQDIGQFDPNAKQEVSDSKVKVDDPILYGLQAYGPMMEQLHKSYIEHALNLYKAENDRYPKDLDEFMTEIIKKNNIKLPVLPAQGKWKYDVENHKLEVVRDVPEKK